MHALLSLQTCAGCVQPVVALQPSSVHGLPSSQLMGTWGRQPVAGSQPSVVQTLLSVQLIGAKTHPVAGSQESDVQAFWSLHVIVVV